MKTILIISLLCSFCSFAQEADSKKVPPKDEKMDEGDKQLLKRDTCRRPMEALVSKYPNLSQAELEKMQKKCDY